MCVRARAPYPAFTAMILRNIVVVGMSLADADPDSEPDPNAAFGQTASNYTNEDKDYGVTWMYIPDGNGVPQVAYLIEEAESTRGRRKNVKEHVFFELYTKWVFSTILNLWQNSSTSHQYRTLCILYVYVNVLCDWMWVRASKKVH